MGGYPGIALPYRSYMDETRAINLLRSGLRGNVLNGVSTGKNLVGVSVRNLNGKLFLEAHDDLHRVQTVESHVVLEVRIWSHLGAVNFVHFLDNAQDAVGDDVLVQVCSMSLGGK